MQVNSELRWVIVEVLVLQLNIMKINKISPHILLKMTNNVD